MDLILRNVRKNHSHLDLLGASLPPQKLQKFRQGGCTRTLDPRRGAVPLFSLRINELDRLSNETQDVRACAWDGPAIRETGIRQRLDSFR